MAEGKNKVVVYKDWIEIFEALTDIEAGKLAKHFFRYINDQNPEPPNRIIEISFNPIKQTLKRDLKAWESKCQVNSEHAKLRWENKEKTKKKMPKYANASERIFSDAKYADSDSDSDRDKDNDSVRVKRIVASPPSLFEVENYFLENGYEVELAKKAFTYYQTADWHDSKGNKVKNWKQKMQSVWFKEENKTVKNGKKSGFNPEPVKSALATLAESKRADSNRILQAPIDINSKTGS